MSTIRNPVKRDMDKVHKPSTHKDKLKDYRRRKMRDKSKWDIDDELYNIEDKDYDPN